MAFLSPVQSRLDTPKINISMLIKELIEPTTNTVQKSKPFDLEKTAQKAEKHSEKASDNIPGYGSYAKATKDPKDPFMFNKKNIWPSNLQNDAYYSYVKAIEPLMGENPYFPRVYVTTLTQDARGLVKPQYQMEKLHDGSYAKNELGAGVSDEAMRALTKKMFVNTDNIWNIWSSIAGYLEKIAKSEKYELIRDPQLVQALQVIKKVKNSNPHFKYDIRDDNLMLRVGPTGFQAVLTDPLQDDGKSEITK